jgi:hypothetical protein
MRKSFPVKCLLRPVVDAVVDGYRDISHGITCTYCAPEERNLMQSGARIALDQPAVPGLPIPIGEPPRGSARVYVDCQPNGNLLPG